MVARKVASPRVRAQLDSVVPEVVEDESRLLDLGLEDAEFGDLEAEHLEVSGCRLTRCRLAGSELEKLILVDTELLHCDVANARWSDAAVTRVAVVSSRMTGFAGPGMVLQHTTITDSLLDYASFRFAKFQRVELTGCRLQSADFVAADLSGAVFRECDLSGAEFSQVKAAGALFVDCTWEGTKGLSALTGATVANSSPIDTLTFATAVTQAAGITLAHPDEVE